MFSHFRTLTNCELLVCEELIGLIINMLERATLGRCHLNPHSIHYLMFINLIYLIKSWAICLIPVHVYANLQTFQQLLQRHDGFYRLWPAQHSCYRSVSDPFGNHLSNQVDSTSPSKGDPPDNLISSSDEWLLAVNCLPIPFFYWRKYMCGELVETLKSKKGKIWFWHVRLQLRSKACPSGEDAQPMRWRNLQVAGLRRTSHECWLLRIWCHEAINMGRLAPKTTRKIAPSFAKSFTLFPREIWLANCAHTCSKRSVRRQRDHLLKSYGNERCKGIIFACACNVWM